MDVFHNRRSSNTPCVLASPRIPQRDLFTRLKCPSQIFYCTRVVLPVHHIPRCLKCTSTKVHVSHGEHVFCLSLSFSIFLLFHVWMCSPVTQLRAKPPCLALECTRATAGFAIMTALSSLSVPYQGASSHSIPVPVTASVCPYRPPSFFFFFFFHSGADRSVPTSAAHTDNCADSGWNKVDST